MPLDKIIVSILLLVVYAYFFGQESFKKYLDDSVIITEHTENPAFITPPAITIFHIFVDPSINKIVRRNYNYKITYYNFSGKSTLVKIAVKSTTIRKTSWITKKSSTKTSFPFPANTVIKDSHQVP